MWFSGKRRPAVDRKGGDGPEAIRANLRQAAATSPQIGRNHLAHSEAVGDWPPGRDREPREGRHRPSLRDPDVAPAGAGKLQRRVRFPTAWRRGLEDIAATAASDGESLKLALMGPEAGGPEISKKI